MFMARPPLNDRNNRSGLIGIGAIPAQSPVASFQIDQIENLLQTKAFLALHYRHAPNPNRETLGEGVNPNQQVSTLRGVRYYSVRQLGVVPQQFKVEDRLSVQGLWGVGSVMMNMTGQYFDGDQTNVYLRPKDLIVLPTLTTMVDQLVEFNPTGPIKLHYKVKGVDYISDATGRIYQEGLDFVIKAGLLYWRRTGRIKPGFRDGKGDILTVVYFITPIYIVQNLPHSLRVIPSNPEGHGAFPRDATYAPQLVVAKPSTLVEENDLLDWAALPAYPGYATTPNVTGGSE